MSEALRPRNPEFEARSRASFERQPMMAHLGARMTVVAPGRIEIEMPYDRRLTQQHGYMHGGALASIADSAAGFAAFTLMAADAQPLTVEYKLNTLRPGIGERFVARAQVIKAGRTLTVVRSDVYGVKDDEETLCVVSIQTIIGLGGRPDETALAEPSAG